MNDLKSRVDYLFKRFTKGTCTPSERKEFLELVRRPEMEALLKELIGREAALADEGSIPLTPSLDEHRADALFARVLSEEPAPVVTMERSRPYRKWWLSAAAVFLMAATASVLWIASKQQGPEPVVQATQPALQDRQPGSNGALLTLSDGSQVVLDSAANGLLARQGSVQLEKRSDGQLVYTAKGAPLETLYNTLTTPRGRQFHITLPDGTDAWLNAASSLYYPVVFTGKERRVVVRGEVYFEVAKNAGKPFVVETKDQEITVLGTHFNINAYEDEEVVRTTLLEGSIRVSNAGGRAVLRPGQETVVSTGRSAPKVQAADMSKAVAWKNGYFSFRNANIKDVIRQLARWYDVNVRFDGEPGSQQFNGEISRDLTLREVLDGLAFTNMHINLEGGNTLVIQP